MSKRETTKVSADIARGVVVEGFKRARVHIKDAESFAAYSDQMRQFSRDIGAEATYMQRLFEGKMQGISAAIFLAIVRKLGLTMDDAGEIKPANPFGSMKGMRDHGGARRRMPPLPALSYIPSNELTKDNEVEIFTDYTNEIETQLVNEYIIGTPTTNQEPTKMVPIKEMPVQAARPVSRELLAKMKPDAEPVIVQISGDYMDPTYPSGSHLLVDASIDQPWQPGVYVVFNGTHFVHRCIRIPGSTPAMVRVIHDNKNYPSFDVMMTSLNICGLVIAALDPETWSEKKYA